jgi:hypothetical protein
MNQLEREWIILNLAGGRDADALLMACRERGMQEAEASEYIESCLTADWLPMARELNYRAEKLSSLMAKLGEFRRELGEDTTLTIASGTPSLTDFQGLLRRNQPLLIQGALRDWPAFGKWSPAFFRDEFGDVLVRASLSREREHYDQYVRQELTELPLREFVEFIEGTAGNTAYLVPASGLLQRPPMDRLLGDIGPIGDLLNPDAPNKPHQSLWIGPAGTVTSLHHDDRSSFLCQVHGVKEVLLYSPFHYEQMRNERYCWSALDPWGAVGDEVGHLDGGVRPIRATIRPGEALLIPVGWWHTVRSLSTSISVTMHNLTVDTRWRQAYWGEAHRWQEEWERKELLPFPHRPPLTSDLASARE